MLANEGISHLGKSLCSKCGYTVRQSKRVEVKNLQEGSATHKRLYATYCFVTADFRPLYKWSCQCSRRITLATHLAKLLTGVPKAEL